MSQRSKKIAGFILLLIFTTYYVNITFFQHSHIINGVTIVHSHIHSQDHAKTGTHSDSEVTLISALSSFQSLQASLWIIGLGTFFSLLAIILPTLENRVVRDIHTCISLRGPPSLS